MCDRENGSLAVFELISFQCSFWVKMSNNLHTLEMQLLMQFSAAFMCVPIIEAPLLTCDFRQGGSGHF